MQFVKTVATGTDVARDSGVAVNVAGMSWAFVGISVAVTKFCVGISRTSFVMDMQEVRKIKARVINRIFFAILYSAKQCWNRRRNFLRLLFDDHGLVLEGVQVSDHGPGCEMNSSSPQFTLKFPAGSGLFAVRVIVSLAIFPELSTVESMLSNW